MLRLCVLIFLVKATGFPSQLQDITTSRPNTLYDNADDIQKQLDNEARDRLKFGRPQTVWVFHIPVRLPEITTVGLEGRYSESISSKNLKKKATSKLDEFLNAVASKPDWGYNDQTDWYKTYPDCGGRAQSPVDLPIHGLVKVRGGRKLVFINYDTEPKNLTLTNDGRRVTLTGEWEAKHQPLVTAGAAYSRRYVFHSMTFHWPSEHTVSGLLYPMESQALHISADYKSLDEAVRESKRDPLAFMGIVNIYTFSNKTQSGVLDVIKAAASVLSNSEPVTISPLGHFNPPFKAYVSYQGSLTTPPCTESVLWLVRGQSLPIVREVVAAAKKLQLSKGDTSILSRRTQSLNDRKIYLFN